MVLAVTDFDLAEAWRFAGQLGSWDELSLGRGWENSLVERFVWVDMPSRPALPQVLLLERETEAGEVVTFTKPVLLARKIGLEEIRTWVELGTPF